MNRPTVSVHDVIDAAKREVGLTPQQLEALETLRDDWFQRRITSTKEFGPRLRKIISPTTMEGLLVQVVPPSQYDEASQKLLERRAARALLQLAQQS